MRYLLLFFLTGTIFCSSCRKIVEAEGIWTSILKNTTNHKIGITLHYRSKPNKAFVIEKNNQINVEEFSTQNSPYSYTTPWFYYSDPSTVADHTDSISVLYDESVLIRHYLDTVKRAVKSYNRDSDRSLFNPKSYIRTVSKSQHTDNDQAFDVQLLYTFTEDDYLFAK